MSQELIRMAILWHEMWHEALEEASRQYFGENNVKAMLETLLPLHKMMEEGQPTTLKEIAFVQARPPPSYLSRASHVDARVGGIRPQFSGQTGYFPEAKRGGDGARLCCLQLPHFSQRADAERNFNPTMNERVSHNGSSFSQEKQEVRLASCCLGIPWCP